MKMNLIRILGQLILVAAFLDCPHKLQTVANEQKRREGEIGLEPAKMDVGGVVAFGFCG